MREHTPTPTGEKPPRMRLRTRRDLDYGHRATNAWGDGDLPAPYAEGDVIRIAPDAAMLAGRMTLDPDLPPLAVVTYCCSIDDGDARYARVTQVGATVPPRWPHGLVGWSDRLHVAWPERSTWPEPHDWMAGTTLLQTSDPDGLERRRQLIDAGWSLTPTPAHCPTCTCRGTDRGDGDP